MKTPVAKPKLKFFPKSKRYVQLHMDDNKITNVFIRLSEWPKNGILSGNKRRVRKFKIRMKPTSVMGEYIALHGLVPANELPKHLRDKIPRNEIWIRKDCFDTWRKRRKLLTHENHELNLMTKLGYKYKEAHKQANLREGIWMVPFEVVD